MDSSASEAELLARARAGDDKALGELYELHYTAARRFAGSLVADPSDAEDLAADAFARVMAQLRGGRGPSTNFRAYLFATVRNRHIDVGRRANRVTPASDQPWVFDEASGTSDPFDHTLDDDHAVAAFASLPDSWQTVLWHVEIEGRPVSEVATLLSVQPAAVSSLAYRAREGLKLAYLDRMVGASPALSGRCGWVQARLSQYVRGGLSTRAASKAEEHIAECARCAAAIARAEQTNRKLAALLLPIVLVGGGYRFGLVGATAPAPDAATAGGGRPRGRGPQTSARVVRGLRARAGTHGLVATVGAGVVGLAAVAALAWSPGGADSRDERPATDGPHVATPAPPSASPATAQPAPTPRTTPLPRPPVEVVTPREPAARPAPRVPPRPQPVTPLAPTATPITRCGTFGSLAMPSTEGVAYTLTEGDGRSGPWSVRARAREGFVLAEGAPTRFSGDLGPFVACPSFADVSATNTSGTVWSVSANVDAFDAASYTIGVELRFDTTVFTGGFTGAGWECSATDGTTPMPLDGTEYQLQPGAQWIVCEFPYEGADPGAVAVTVDAGVPGDLSGIATLVRDGVTKGSRAF